MMENAWKSTISIHHFQTAVAVNFDQLKTPKTSHSQLP